VPSAARRIAQILRPRRMSILTIRVAGINFEQAQIMELRDQLSGVKNNKVNALTLASINPEPS
jgi:hypothetical protein